MKPNLILNLLWKIPTIVYHYFVFKTTGYIFARKEENGKPISYYFDKRKDLPKEFKS